MSLTGVARVVGVRCDVGAFEYNPLRYVYLPLTLRQVRPQARVNHSIS